MQGRTNNLTNKAIAEISTLFYYSANGLAHLFPGVFKSEVPELGVALVATAVCASQIIMTNSKHCLFQVKCVLDEWRGGQHKNVPFTAQEYRAVYQAIVELIKQIQGNEYHKNKFLAARRSWAQDGK